MTFVKLKIRKHIGLTRHHRQNPLTLYIELLCSFPWYIVNTRQDSLLNWEKFTTVLHKCAFIFTSFQHEDIQDIRVKKKLLKQS